jgi:hypothetical protein
LPPIPAAASAAPEPEPVATEGAESELLLSFARLSLAD